MKNVVRFISTKKIFIIAGIILVMRSSRRQAALRLLVQLLVSVPVQLCRIRLLQACASPRVRCS